MDFHETSRDDEEIVHLVVGDDTESKSQVADLIAAHEGAEELETTKSGGRIFTTASHKKVVVDTRVFPKVGEESPQKKYWQQIAKQWISQNSLRRILFGKFLSVVCVLTSSVDCEISDVAYKKKFAWLDILGVMFQEHKQAIRILVNIHEDKLTSAAQHIKRSLNQQGFINPIYLDLRRGGVDLESQFIVHRSLLHQGALVKSIHGHHVYSGDENGPSGETPFFLKEPAMPKNPTTPSSTPWSPERVILFGRTGSGKSTLAQMLTIGKLEPDSKIFSSSSGIRGHTKHVSVGQGRGWYVVDTPGFGEPNSNESRVPTQVAEERIKKFVKTIDGLYTHFLYVVKKNRFDVLDLKLWQFFVRLFGSDIDDHFSVVISDADEEWVNDNFTHLAEFFKGCRSFLSVDFPPSQGGDAEWEGELQEIRMESLKRLENALADLSRKDVVCQHGNSSISARMNRNARCGHGLSDVCQNAAELFTTLCSSSLTDTLKVDQNIVLIPA